MSIRTFDQDELDDVPEPPPEYYVVVMYQAYGGVLDLEDIRHRAESLDEARRIVKAISTRFPRTWIRIEVL